MTYKYGQKKDDTLETAAIDGGLMTLATPFIFVFSSLELLWNGFWAAKILAILEAHYGWRHFDVVAVCLASLVIGLVTHPASTDQDQNDHSKMQIIGLLFAPIFSYLVALLIEAVMM